MALRKVENVANSRRLHKKIKGKVVINLPLSLFQAE